jgi:formamidopyrimidine-DNA glycosylase
VPELPEVEVLRRSLEPHLVGRRVDRIEVWNGNLRETVDRRRLEHYVLGRRLRGAGRRAKYLLLDLEEAATLVVHLGMSGRLTLTSANAPQQKHEHLRFFLDSGSALRFRDPRRFGLVFALPSRRLARDRHFRHLGLEPLDGELSGDSLHQLARGRRGPVKSFLMDASVVVGLGNIYAAEALFRAGIHPSRSVARISRQSWRRLAGAIQETLQQAIAEGGTTLNDFADGSGREGTFQISLAVYGQAGEPCPRCAVPIRCSKHAGRTTYYCPRCQR